MGLVWGFWGAPAILSVLVRSFPHLSDRAGCWAFAFRGSSAVPSGAERIREVVGQGLAVERVSSAGVVHYVAAGQAGHGMVGGVVLPLGPSAPALAAPGGIRHRSCSLRLLPVSAVLRPVCRLALLAAALIFAMSCSAVSAKSRLVIPAGYPSSAA